MKKFKLFAILTAMIAFSGVAMADGMMFEPVDVNYTPVDRAVSSANSAAAEADAALIQGA